MIKLEISGANAQEFFNNALNTLAVFGRAFTQPNAAAPVVTPAPVPQAQIESGDGAKLSPLTGEPLVEAKRKPTKEEKKAAKDAAKKAAVTATPPEVAAPVDGVLDGGVDFLSDLGDEPPATVVTIEDVRNSIRAYNKAVADRGETLEVGVKKITPLFEKYNIKKVSDLKPEQYAEFKAAVQPYIDGTA